MLSGGARIQSLASDTELLATQVRLGSIGVKGLGQVVWSLTEQGGMLCVCLLSDDTFLHEVRQLLVHRSAFFLK